MSPMKGISMGIFGFHMSQAEIECVPGTLSVKN